MATAPRWPSPPADSADEASRLCPDVEAATIGAASGGHCQRRAGAAAAAPAPGLPAGAAAAGALAALSALLLWRARIGRLALGALLLVALGFASGPRLRRLRAGCVDPSGAAAPRTAFCVSGNVREGHGAAQAGALMAQLARIDEHGVLFAHVNPCPAQTRPWDWEGPGEWRPPGCAHDPWQNSSFREVLHLDPARLRVYSEADVAPPPRNCTAPDGAGEGVTAWKVGVYQQLKAESECLRMVSQFEEQVGWQFDFVVRLRPDQCKDPEWCKNIDFCHIGRVDSSRAYTRFHQKATVWDNFAIVPRRYAAHYFTAVRDYPLCHRMVNPWGFWAFGGAAAGEGVLSHHLFETGLPTFPITDINDILGTCC